MLDLSSGLGCLLVGHSHPKVVEAVQRQAAKFSHTDFSVVPYEIYVELCERLVERVGPGRKVALFNSGAEAVENAVKFAKAATGRHAVICFEGAFHGRTLLTMSLTSRAAPLGILGARGDSNNSPPLPHLHFVFLQKLRNQGLGLRSLSLPVYQCEGTPSRSRSIFLHFNSLETERELAFVGICQPRTGILLL
jgi:hypothetical protein